MSDVMKPEPEVPPRPPAQDAITGPLSGLETEVRGLREALGSLHGRLDQLEAAVAAATKQVGFIPSQVRQLGNKVDGLTTAVSEPRLRSLLQDLLGVHDLVDQLLRGSAAMTEADHRRGYDVVRAQVRQILALNGLSEIAATGEFDPTIHRALERVACADRAGDNQVLEVVRPGFRTEQAILRYAEVRVGYYLDPGPGSGDQPAAEVQLPPENQP